VSVYVDPAFHKENYAKSDCPSRCQVIGLIAQLLGSAYTAPVSLKESKRCLLDKILLSFLFTDFHSVHWTDISGNVM
jgi:hypothetical protein